MTGKKKPARPDQGLAAQMSRWSKLVRGVQNNLDDLGFTAEKTAQLEKLAEEVLCAIGEQRNLTCRLRILVRERDEKIRQAQDLRSRIVAAVIGRYGIYSDKLREFGLKPRARGRRVVARGEVAGRS